MSYNTTIRTHGVQLTKHLLSIFVVGLIATIEAASTDPRYASLSLERVLGWLPGSLFFVAIAYIPVYLLYDYADINSERRLHRVGRAAAATLGSGIALYSVFLGINLIDYYVNGPSQVSPNPNDFLAADVAGAILLGGAICAVLFLALRLTYNVLTNRLGGDASNA